MLTIRRRILFTVFGVALLGHTGFGNAKIESRIKELDHTWANAYIKRDIATLEKLMSDDLVTTDAAGTTFLKGKQQDIASVKSGELVYETFQIEKVDVKVHGDTAVAVGRFSTSGKSKGTPFSGRFAYTETWVNRNGQWKAVAEHITAIQP